MHPRHRLDLAAGDVWSGLTSSVLDRRDEEELEGAVLATCDLTGRGLVTLSVRSGWDLLLSVWAWSAGSEVIVTAITHPEMIGLIEAHGLRPVPVDLDPVTLTPDPAELAAAVSERTRAILVAQLLGGRIDLSPILALGRRHGLVVVEDAAQAFTGADQMVTPGVDVSLYSFGLIKTATAVGGAVVGVRDPVLLRRLVAAHQGWPQLARRSYAARLLTAAGLLVLGHPVVYGAFFAVCAVTRRDLDAVVNGATRSFRGRSGRGSAAAEIDLRRRPSRALLALLLRRLQNFDSDRLQRRAAAGEALTAALPAAYGPLGSAQLHRTHWLVPMVVAEPERLRAELRRVGIDASRGTSNLAAVGGASGGATPRAAAAMASVIYLPVYPELPDQARRRMVSVLGRWPATPPARMAP